MKLVRLILLLSGLFLSFSFIANAQDVLGDRVYRVTAYKMGNNSVTSTSNYAEVIPPISIYIPSAFTPNGDGLNDAFGVKGDGIKDYHLYIYNRWGEVLFDSTNPRQQWDGTVSGNKVETGTYVYQLFAKGLSSKGKTGAVTVIY